MEQGFAVVDKRRFTADGDTKADALPGQPISLDEEVREIMAELATRHTLPESPEGLAAVHAEIRQQLVQQRVVYRAMLQRAQSELVAVSCKQLRASELHTVKGMRQKFIITLGRFIYGKGGTWLFEPTNSDALEKALRFARLKDASNYGVSLHKQLLSTCKFDEDGKIVSEGWKEEMATNIAQELAALEVE